MCARQSNQILFAGVVQEKATSAASVSFAQRNTWNRTDKNINPSLIEFLYGFELLDSWLIDGSNLIDSLDNYYFASHTMRHFWLPRYVWLSLTSTIRNVKRIQHSRITFLCIFPVIFTFVFDSLLFLFVSNILLFSCICLPRMLKSPVLDRWQNKWMAKDS